MKSRKSLNLKRIRRQHRVRSRLMGSAEKPRLSVFRSNRYIYAQLINDEKKHTLISASSHDLKSDVKKKKGTEQAALTGALIAQKAIEAGITKAVFDRGSYKYHGRVKALAEGARQAGLLI